MIAPFISIISSAMSPSYQMLAQTSKLALETHEFIFSQPSWLWALLLLLPLLLLRRKKGSSSYIKHPGIALLADQLPQPHTRITRFGPLLLILASSCFIIAAAQPQWRSEHSEEKVSGIDIMIACDLSGSMSLRDMIFTSKDARGRILRHQVDRLTAAKEVITRFIEKRPNDRIGLIAFAGKAKLSCPLTLDHGILDYIINQFFLDDPLSGRKGYVEYRGTAIGSAIASAASRLEERDETKSKIIILVTDGQNNRGNINPIEAAKQAAILGIRIFTIAIGQEGQRLSTNIASDGIDEKTLKEIAKISKGRYFRANSGAELMLAFSNIDTLEKTEVKKRRLIIFEHLFSYPLALGFLLLCLSFMLKNLRPQPAP